MVFPNDKRDCCCLTDVMTTDIRMHNACCGKRIIFFDSKRFEAIQPTKAHVLMTENMIVWKPGPTGHGEVLGSVLVNGFRSVYKISDLEDPAEDYKNDFDGRYFLTYSVFINCFIQTMNPMAIISVIQNMT